MKTRILVRYQVVVALTPLLLTGLPGLSQAQVRIEVRPFESVTLTGDAFLRGEPGKPPSAERHRRSGAPLYFGRLQRRPLLPRRCRVGANAVPP
jgi:hypothetical protein